MATVDPDAVAAVPRTEWHVLRSEEVAARLAVDPEQGLDPAEAASRLAERGPNSLPEAPGKSRLRLLVAQFASLLVGILVAGAVLSAAMGEWVDAIAILTILLLNAALGYLQEHRAADALASLRRMSAPTARVRREGREAVVPAADVVPGDLVVLEAGDRIPADLRLVRSSGLRVVEASLTGESEPAEKAAEAVATAPAGLGDRRGMVFASTTVACGVAEGLAVATGPSTEIGRIAGLVREAPEGETPLQARLRAFGKWLVLGTGAVVVLVFALGLLRGVAVYEMLLTSVSLAVAAVPEGLPTVVTIALALGVARMAKRNALIRRLPAVETLGCTTVICTDKTGTLTVGEMTVRTVVTIDDEVAVEGEGYRPRGGFLRGGRAEALVPGETAHEALRTALACSTARLVEEDGNFRVAGDPTEGALVVAALKAGIAPESLDAAERLVSSLPFDSERKRMSVVRRVGDGDRAYVKGAPESVLPRCVAVRTRHGTCPLTAEERERLQGRAGAMASAGQRVLAMATKEMHGSVPAGAEDPEAGLTFVGLAGMQDPPRPEARAAVAACREAGIRSVMITGDHPGTAFAIARSLGIAEREEEALSGTAVEGLGDAELEERVSSISVYARVNPEHKLRIVRAWRKRGAVVAMTGDGVNDAPALRGADIGVAMGRTGTDVAKDASAMVITDDNFASIVAAVEEGRTIYENIRKTLLYLLSGNFAEILVMAVAVVAGWPLPLVPIQLLWINLVTDGLPALALATDPADRDLFRVPPRRPGAEIADREFLGAMVGGGLLIAACTIAAFLFGLWGVGSLETARTYAFSVLVAGEVLRAFAARSRTKVLWELGLFSNGRLFLVAAVTLAFQFWSHHSGALAGFLRTGTLTAAECAAVFALAAVPTTVIETAKLARRWRRTPSPATA
ncbi:MAG TPA: cation-translocating P-type ATPase [Planctomycetota bacterium]|nr:cation-translocating P-type ATPase [Planctomycetota bacterium]